MRYANTPAANLLKLLDLMLDRSGASITAFARQLNISKG